MSNEGGFDRLNHPLVAWACRRQQQKTEGNNKKAEGNIKYVEQGWFRQAQPPCGTLLLPELVEGNNKKTEGNNKKPKAT